MMKPRVPSHLHPIYLLGERCGFLVGIDTQDPDVRVQWAAPVAAEFLGRPLVEAYGWLREQGTVRVCHVIRAREISLPGPTP